jgi:hypothetical protein
MGVTGHPSLGLGAFAACVFLFGRAVAMAVSAAIGLVWPRPRRRRVARSARRPIRVLTLASLLILVPAGVSYVSDLVRPSNSTIGIRSVEWLRDNGAAWLVSDIENAYYSLTAPDKGGPGLRELPVVGLAPELIQRKPHVRGSRPPSPPVYAPPRVRPVVAGQLQLEGVWRPTQPARTGSPPAVLVTSFRPDPSYPRTVAGLAWIGWHGAALALYPGRREPPGASGVGASVPTARRGQLLATFNSGFKHKDGQGGFFSLGRLWEPLVQGQGTIVATRGGRFDVRAWGGGARPGGDVLLARQNLPLIVDHGQPNPNLGNGPEWGFTVNRDVLVWRSGVGADRRGNLIYAAANHLSVSTLARALSHAGAVRAVELDINSFWVSFITYARGGARGARNLLPDMTRPVTRYLTPDDRDFFAVYRR